MALPPDSKVILAKAACIRWWRHRRLAYHEEAAAQRTQAAMQAQGEQSQMNVQHLVGQSLAHIAEAERLVRVAPAEALGSTGAKMGRTMGSGRIFGCDGLTGWPRARGHGCRFSEALGCSSACKVSPSKHK